MSTKSPPKPWERFTGKHIPFKKPVLCNLKMREADHDGNEEPSPSSSPATSTSVSVATTTSPTTATSLTTTSPPTIPQRPPSLTATVNRNASAYASYNPNRVGMPPNYGGLPSQYSNPYQRMGGIPYSRMGGVYGMGGMTYGAMGGMYNGMGGMMGETNDPNSLTNGFTRNTQATFQMIENIVGAFGGLAQMLESTYMATHSSFFAMVSVAEQFGNLKNTLGSILGIFTFLRWLRIAFAKLTGRPPPADVMSLTPKAFAKFEGRKTFPDGSPINPSRPSRKPFLFFIAAAFGLPYLMGKLIQALAASQEEQQNRLVSSGQFQTGPDGQLTPMKVDPSKLDFCRVLYDFSPQSKSTVPGVDLEVKRGDLVAVLSQDDPMGNPSEWWRCRARDGRMGYLPKAYLEVAKRPGQPIAQIKPAGQDISLKDNNKGKVTQQNEDENADITMESFQKSQFHS